LIRSLHALHSAGRDTAEAVEKLNLSPLTADEETLSQLASRSREIVPALAEMRSKAADRSVLMSLVETAANHDDDVSDGESSAHEFEVGSSSGGEEEEDEPGARKQKMAPLVLPNGWHVNRFQRGTWAGREFVDPAGKVYRSEQQARKAIDLIRRAANMASRHAELGARLRARQVYVEQQTVPASTEVSRVGLGDSSGVEANAKSNEIYGLPFEAPLDSISHIPEVDASTNLDTDGGVTNEANLVVAAGAIFPCEQPRVVEDEPCMEKDASTRSGSSSNLSCSEASPPPVGEAEGSSTE